MALDPRLSDRWALIGGAPEERALWQRGRSERGSGRQPFPPSPVPVRRSASQPWIPGRGRFPHSGAGRDPCAGGRFSSLLGMHGPPPPRRTTGWAAGSWGAAASHGIHPTEVGLKDLLPGNRAPSPPEPSGCKAVFFLRVYTGLVDVTWIRVEPMGHPNRPAFKQQCFWASRTLSHLLPTL